MPNGETEFARIQETDELQGSNWNIGVLWRSEKLNVGAVYRGAFAAQFDSRTSAQSNVADSQLPGLFTASYQVHWPETYGAGITHLRSWRSAAPWNCTPNPAHGC